MTVGEQFQSKDDDSFGAYMAAARFLNEPSATSTAWYVQSELNPGEFIVSNSSFTVVCNVVSVGAGWVAQVSFPKAKRRRYVYPVHLFTSPSATQARLFVSDETLLQDVVKRVFPLAQFEIAKQMDTEEGWERPILYARTGCSDLAQRLQAEDRFYEMVAAEPRLVSAIRKITVSFSAIFIRR